MKDLLILKFKGRSKITVEGYTGYFVIKKNGDMRYKILQYPMSFSSIVNCETKEPFKLFQRKLSDATTKLLRDSPQFRSVNSELNRYVKRRMIKDMSFGAKLLTANKVKDEEVTKTLMKDFFEDWVEDLNLDIEIEEVNYSEFSKQFSRFSTPEDVMDVLKREDLEGLSEVYPIVDPINGKPISHFDVGEQIYFTVLKFSDDDSKSKILEAFPDNFNESGENVSPLIGMIVSKEIAGNDFFLIKIECEGVRFKSVVYNGVNIMEESVRVPKAKDETEESVHSSQNREELEMEKEKLNILDLSVALLLVSGVVLTIMVLIYFFFWK